MKQLPFVAAAFCFLAAGCGSSPITFPDAAKVSANKAITCDSTAPAAISNSQFAAQATETTLSLYPGQTATIDVALSSLDGAVHQAQISATHLPAGLTVAPIQASTGSTVKLTLQASPELATNCFSGVEGVFSASIPIAVTASASSLQSSSIIDLTVVLENPTFAPTKTDLPVMRLATSDGSDVTSEDDYVDGSVQLTDPSNSDNNFKDTMQIKGHGNSTWLMPKKPYNLKLDSKEGILGMASSKKWILLANYDDKTMMRDALAFHISQMFQMVWTPNSRFIELYLNGVYEGVYQITEKVEIDTNRLNITEIDDTDNTGDALTGGYLMEFDQEEDATFVFHTPRNLPIDSVDPDPPTDQQQTYMTSLVDTAENALYSSSFQSSTTGWPAYLDQQSFVNFFIINELMGNQDGDLYSSDYFYKMRGDPLLYMGPVWDFDVSSGNDNFSPVVSPNVPWMSVNAPWYVRLLQDPAFEAAVKARWAQIRPQVGGIPSFIDTTAASLNQGQQNNFQRWPILYDRVWPNPVAYGTYQGEVGYLKNWMSGRIAYMDATYGK